MNNSYPSITAFGDFVELKDLRPRTKTEYLRHIRKLAEHCQCDPATLPEARVRDYFLHRRTQSRWGGSAMNHTECSLRYFFVAPISPFVSTFSARICPGGTRLRRASDLFPVSKLGKRLRVASPHQSWNLADFVGGVRVLASPAPSRTSDLFPAPRNQRAGSSVLSVFSVLNSCLHQRRGDGERRAPVWQEKASENPCVYSQKLAHSVHERRE